MNFKTIYTLIPEKFRRDLTIASVLSVLCVALDFLSIVLLIPIFLGFFNIGSPAASRMIFPEVLQTLFETQKTGLLLGVVCFFVMKNWLAVRMLRFQSHFSYRLSNALSIGLLHNYFSKSLLETRLERNSALIKDLVFVPNDFVAYILSSCLTLLSEGLLLLLVLLALFLIQPMIALLMCVLLLIIVMMLFFYEKQKLRTANRDVSSQYNQNTNHLLNAVNGYAEIKINQMESFFLKQFEQSNGALNKRYATLQTERLTKPKYTETLLVCCIAALFVLSRYFSDAASGILFVSFLFAAAMKIIPGVNRMLIAVTNLASYGYTIDILAKNGTASVPPQTTTLIFQHEIALRDIHFAFSAEKPVLKDLSLTITKSSVVGIFGDSGNGKSTLINILSGLVAPDSGQLYCDTESINKSNHHSWLSQIAYVPQMPFFFEGSIRENLLTAGHTVDSKKIDQLLEWFELKEIIAALPQKLDTFIGNNGYLLSGGQLQRLALIRALIRNPAILLLDEATNQLDRNLQQRINTVLKTIVRQNNLTIVSVSHNKDELGDFCDNVYHLKNGSLTKVR